MRVCDSTVGKHPHILSSPLPLRFRVIGKAQDFHVTHIRHEDTMVMSSRGG